MESVLQRVPQHPLRDRDDQAHVCFENGVVVLTKDRAPKTIIYTIDATARSDRRRLWFVPISTFYGEQEELTGKTPADFHNGRLCDKHVWDEKE